MTSGFRFIFREGIVALAGVGVLIIGTVDIGAPALAEVAVENVGRIADVGAQRALTRTGIPVQLITAMASTCTRALAG